MKTEEKYDNFPHISEEERKCLKGYKLILLSNNIPEHIFSIGYERKSRTSITATEDKKWNVLTIGRDNTEVSKEFDSLYDAVCYMTSLIATTKEQEEEINKKFEAWQKFIDAVENNFDISQRTRK